MISPTVYYYSVYDDDFGNAYKFESRWISGDDEDYARYIAEDAAENYHVCHDGWEANWPLCFYIYDKDGKIIGVFDIERENRPEFSATMRKKPIPPEADHEAR